MSENKYIIDKDSLTGIADAVRDKLGTGEAITDEDAGYYPVLTKGVCFTTGGFTGRSYMPSGGYQQILYYNPGLNGNISWADNIINWCGEKPAKIRFTVVSNPSGQSTINLAQASTEIVLFETTKVKAGNSIIIDYPADENPNFQITQLVYGSYSGSSYTTATLKIQFLDSNKNIYPLQQENITSFINGYNNSSFKTAAFQDFNRITPISYSIDDIQNRINNHLTKRGKREVFVAMPGSSDSVEFNSLNFKLSKYLATGTSFNLNFKASSPYYITEKIPKINPESISFIYFKGFDGYYGTEYQFIFDSSVKSVEHYTSASIKEGKRLSSATDYYFYPDTNGTYSSSTYNNNYGLMGVWDANNKILDLGFQNVSSRSGNSISSNYTSVYKNSTRDFIIVYEEATE